MSRHFLRSYVELLVYTCHKRGAHAMGGMAAQIPIKNNEKENKLAKNMVAQDKKREADAGHDGTWIAHPGLASIALNAFNAVMPDVNQIHKKVDNPNISQQDLLQVPPGEITEKGLRDNIKVGLQYVEAWLLGNGCVPLYNLMEDAATAEISRSQIWQWITHKASFTGTNQTIDENLFISILDQEMTQLIELRGDSNFDQANLDRAIDLFQSMSTSSDFDQFLTLPAYKFL